MTDWDGRGLVSTEWLAGHLGEPDLRIFDVTMHLRPTSEPGPSRLEDGRKGYEEAHIPGAVYLDLLRQFSDRAAPVPFTHLPADQLGRALGNAGARPGDRVVIYSRSLIMWATRFWWMLKAAGFENAAVLDGGFSLWKAEGRPVETGSRDYPAVDTLPLTERPGTWADTNEVLAAIGDGDVCTINALAPEVHRGEGDTNYGRKGRIKGSVNVSAFHLMDDQGRFRSDAELRPLFDAVGAFGKPRVICYCGGGVSATMDALMLTRLGHPSVAVYDGSMAEWSNNHSLPMETGPQ